MRATGKLCKKHTICDRCYTFNLEESVEGLHAVSVPITGQDNVAIGAINMSEPANRLDGSLL